VDVPARPAYNPNPALGVVDILEYVETLELLLHNCADGTGKRELSEVEAAAKESTKSVLRKYGK
jgi:hypothetical protein